MLRCKRCFKKYNGHDLECPRCGRLNEYEDDFSETESTTDIDDSKSTSWFKNVKCEVCGKSSLSNKANCPSCFNSNILSNSKKKIHVEAKLINNLIKHSILDSNNKVDMLALSHEANLINLDLSSWETPIAFEFGKTMTVKNTILMIVSFLFFSVLGRFDSIKEMIPIGGLILIVGLIMLSFRRKTYVTGLRITKLASHEESVITYFEENKGKRGRDVFKLWSYDLESIHVVIIDDHLESINFVEKLNDSEKQIDHQVYPVDFNDSHDFIKVILFFCYKYNISLFVKEDVILSNINESIN